MNVHFIDEWKKRNSLAQIPKKKIHAFRISKNKVFCRLSKFNGVGCSRGPENSFGTIKSLKIVEWPFRDLEKCKFSVNLTHDTIVDFGCTLYLKWGWLTWSVVSASLLILWNWKQTHILWKYGVLCISLHVYPQYVVPPQDG